MKKNILVMMFASILLFTGCGCDKKENEKNNGNNGTNGNGTGENNTVVDPNAPTVENPAIITNEEMTKDQTVEELEFTSTGLTYDGNMTTLTSQVTNKSEDRVTLTTVMATIKYINEYDEERTLEMEVYFGESLEPGETRSVFSTVDVDLRKSSSIEYRIVR